MNTTISEPKHRRAKRTSKDSDFAGDKKAIAVKGRLWLEVDGETFIAPGRVTLLERIDEYGSITKAAKSMKMSYRHAWLLVDDMNKKAPSPLVMRVTGGKGGGGTSLTEEGKTVVTRFKRMLEELKILTERLTAVNGNES